MVKNLDVEAYFLREAEKKTFTELSANKKTKKPLVENEANGYDYEKLALSFFARDPLKMVDAVYISGGAIFLFEFKGGLNQKITYDTFDISRWWCETASKFCEEGAKVFLENQELKISELLDSIKGKLLETYVVFYKMILPNCVACDKTYSVNYVTVVDNSFAPLSAIEDGLNELGQCSPNETNPITRVKKSLKKYEITGTDGEPLFFDSIETWSVDDFNARIKE